MLQTAQFFIGCRNFYSGKALSIPSFNLICTNSRQPRVSEARDNAATYDAQTQFGPKRINRPRYRWPICTFDEFSQANSFFPHSENLTFSDRLTGLAVNQLGSLVVRSGPLPMPFPLGIVVVKPPPPVPLEQAVPRSSTSRSFLGRFPPSHYPRGLLIH